MKKIFLLSLLFSVVFSYAQVPFKFNFQTVVRDAKGKPFVGNVSLRIKIYDAGSGGALLYQEEHTNMTSNEFGLINLQIGTGTVSVGTSLASLDWTTGTRWIETEMNTGTGFLIVGGRSQLVAVPFAITSQNSEIANKAHSADIKYVTTGQIAGLIPYDSAGLWKSGGQQLIVPANGTYLILCTANARFDQSTKIPHGWRYKIRKNNTQDLGEWVAVNAYDYYLPSDERATFSGEMVSTSQLIAPLNTNDIVSVEYMTNSITGQKSAAQWWVRENRSLTLIKLAD